MVSQRRRGAILGYANIAVKNLVNLIYTPMLLGYVGRGDYGVFQTANSFVFSLTLLSFGFSGAYVRFYSKRKADGDEDGIRVLNGMYLTLYLLICMVAVVLGLFASANVGSVFSGSFTQGEVQLAGTLMAIMTFNVATTLFSTVFDAYVIVHEEFTFQQTRQMLTTLATPGVALLLLNQGMGAVGVAIAQLAVSVVLLALNARFAIARLGMRFDVLHPDIVLLRAIAAFSAWIFLNQITDLAVLNLPNVILGALSGAEVVAVFAVAVQIRTVFMSLSTTISNVFVPLVNREVAGGSSDEVLTALVSRVGRYQAFLYLWVLGGFAVVGRWFVGVWAGQSFDDAYWMTLVMAAALFVPLVQNVGIEIQRAKNLHRSRSFAYLLTTSTGLVLTYTLAPRFGYWAAVVGFCAHMILGPILYMNYFNHRVVGLNMFAFWRKVAPIALVGSAIALGCVLGTTTIPVCDAISFVLWGGVYTVAYVLANWLLTIDVEERKSVAKRIRMLRKRGEDVA